MTAAAGSSRIAATWGNFKVVGICRLVFGRGFEVQRRCLTLTPTVDLYSKAFCLHGSNGAANSRDLNEYGHFERRFANHRGLRLAVLMP